MKLDKKQKQMIGGIAAVGISALGIYMAKKKGLFSFAIVRKPPISRRRIAHPPADSQISVYSPISTKYITRY